MNIFSSNCEPLHGLTKKILFSLIEKKFSHFQMSRLKNENQKQLDRKIKRHTDFDNGRGLEKYESER